MDRSTRDMVYGHVDIRSPWFSSRWRVERDGETVCTLQRLGRIYTTVVDREDSRWILDPHGTGVVRAIDGEGREFGRVVRRSWVGRRWDLVSQSWNYELVSDPRPRSWGIRVGGAPAASIRGSLVSYNRVKVDALIGVPLVAVLLSWHVVARPWEAIAEPSGLVPGERQERLQAQALDPLQDRPPIQRGPGPFTRP